MNVRTYVCMYVWHFPKDGKGQATVNQKDFLLGDYNGGYLVCLLIDYYQ